MTVTSQNEIELNGEKYRIKGGVVGSWENPFPEQFTLGDADYANRRDLSSWIINDLRFNNINTIDTRTLFLLQS